MERRGRKWFRCFRQTEWGIVIAVAVGAVGAVGAVEVTRSRSRVCVCFPFCSCECECEAGAGSTTKPPSRSRSWSRSRSRADHITRIWSRTTISATELIPDTVSILHSLSLSLLRCTEYGRHLFQVAGWMGSNVIRCCREIVTHLQLHAECPLLYLFKRPLLVCNATRIQLVITQNRSF